MNFPKTALIENTCVAQFLYHRMYERTYGSYVEGVNALQMMDWWVD